MVGTTTGASGSTETPLALNVAKYAVSFDISVPLPSNRCGVFPSLSHSSFEHLSSLSIKSARLQLQGYLGFRKTATTSRERHAAAFGWSKSISVIAIVAWYKINFIGLQLYRNESELIRIPGFVPCNFCRVLFMMMIFITIFAGD